MKQLRHFIVGAVCCGAAISLAAQSTGPLQVLITDIHSSENRWALKWSDAGVGFSYSVQARTGLQEGIWITPRSTLPWPIGVQQWVDVAEQPYPSRFYRVVAVPIADRGRLVSEQEVLALTAAQINLLLAFTGVQMTVPHGVKVHKLTYETVDPWGGRTLASGALAVPQNSGLSLALCSYQHGTIARRNEAPSSSSSTEQLLGVVMGGSGYATVLPDYLGLGDSPGVHPFHHAVSEATASVDMLRAARAWCADYKVALNGQLFLVGYSQGGHATMALHRELEEYHTNEFAVTASAPMAGAYDLSAVTTDDVLSGRSMPNQYYFAMLLASYQAVYGLAASLPVLLASPYDTKLSPLLNGQHSASEINAAMPADPTRILKQEYLAAFRSQPDHPLRLALRDNDLHRWTPKAPMRLYHCRADSDVIIRNSQAARDSFRGRGATQVELIDPDPSADHDACSIPSLLLAKTWFDSFRLPNTP